MRFLRKSSEDEVILEFLCAESGSIRFAQDIKAAAGAADLDALIRDADLGSAEQCARRRAIMAAYRGWGKDRELFERFPNPDWQLWEFDRDDLDAVKYIDYSYWNELSGGTRYARDSAAMIKSGRLVYDMPYDYFHEIAARLADGEAPPRMIFLSDGRRFTVVEGHARITGYHLCFASGVQLPPVEVFVGMTDAASFERWD